MYCYYQDQLLTEESVASVVQNRSFKYGDGLFETVRVFQGNPLFIEKHYRRLCQSMQQMKYSMRSFLSLDAFYKIATNLVRKNGIDNGRLRIHVYRNGEGLYTPTDHTPVVLVELHPLGTENLYSLSAEGIDVGVYREHPLPYALVPGKTASSLFYVLAGIYRREKQWDEVLLMDENGFVIEGGSSNVFALYGDVLHTPPLYNKGIQGVFRSVLQDFIAQQNRWQYEEKSFAMEELKKADAVFVTNVIGGVRWVQTCEGHRWMKGRLDELHKELMEYIQHYEI